MARVHLVACGNPLCGDDAAGSLLLHQLQEAAKGTDFARDVRFTELGLGISEWRRLLRADERVIFLDAAVGLGTPGAVSLRIFDAELIETGGIDHGLHPLRQFALERALYPNELPAEAWLCFIHVPHGEHGPSRSIGTDISETTLHGVQAAALLLTRLLRSWSR